MQKRATSSVGNERIKTTAAPVAKTVPVAASKSAASPSRDEIARRAHEIYVARGQSGGGSEMEDWLQAERELTGAKSRNN
jgi:hypothetical protein